MNDRQKDAPKEREQVNQNGPQHGSFEIIFLNCVIMAEIIKYKMEKPRKKRTSSSGLLNDLTSFIASPSIYWKLLFVAGINFEWILS
jgi:hypothetical protein